MQLKKNNVLHPVTIIIVKKNILIYTLILINPTKIIYDLYRFILQPTDPVEVHRIIVDLRNTKSVGDNEISNM